jgi:hypothetical protein
MDKVNEPIAGYQQIGAFIVHEGAIMALTGWRPYYWKTLTLQTRNEIDASTLNVFTSSLEEHAREDVGGYHETYYQWLIYLCANRAHCHFSHSCRTELEKRKRAIQNNKRVPCGARKKTGQQCKAKAELGSNRCRFHGGKSTGPKTIDGKIKSLSKLTQYRRQPHLLIAKRRELITEMRTKTGF